MVSAERTQIPNPNFDNEAHLPNPRQHQASILLPHARLGDSVFAWSQQPSNFEGLEGVNAHVLGDQAWYNLRQQPSYEGHALDLGEEVQLQNQPICDYQYTYYRRSGMVRFTATASL